MNNKEQRDRDPSGWYRKRLGDLEKSSISDENFKRRYFLRMQIAGIDGETEKDVIKKERDLISGQEEKFQYYHNQPKLSAFRIFLNTREELIEDPNLNPLTASSNGHSKEAERLDILSESEIMKKPILIKALDSRANLFNRSEKLKLLSNIFRDEAELLRTQSFLYISSKKQPQNPRK